MKVCTDPVCSCTYPGNNESKVNFIAKCVSLQLIGSPDWEHSWKVILVELFSDLAHYKSKADGYDGLKGESVGKRDR